MKFYLVAIGAMLLSGCATTQQALPVPKGEIPSDVARIQLDFIPYRNIELTWDYLVKDNGVIVGKLGGLDGQLVWERPAGKTCITVADTNYFGKQCFNAIQGKLTELTFSLGTGISIRSFDSVNDDVKIIDVQNM